MVVRNMRPNQAKKVVVGMSGGVDSSVAAALLKKEGYDVSGVFMKNWADPKYPCPWKEDRRDAMRVAAVLDIQFETWDFTKEYRASVVDYMVREYAAGRTPNPDVMCNREIKFGLFLEWALERGADYVATGHYVKKIKNEKLKSKNYRLAIAKDLNKDQSYFLWTLTQEQLAHSLFPIGDYTKPEVRKLARKFGLPTADKPDSQGICFIGEIDLGAFLRDELGTKLGKVLTTAGKIVGEHEGVQFYTIGQRHGLGFGGGIPFYVVEKDAKTNMLVVAEGPNDNALFSKELTVESINWISGETPTFPLRCEARIRYKQPLQACSVERIADSIGITFGEEQRAVTPGQSVVFYKKGVMLGGGIIQ